MTDDPTQRMPAAGDGDIPPPPPPGDVPPVGGGPPPPPGGQPPPPGDVPPGAPPPGGFTTVQSRVLIGLLAAVVVLLAVIGGVLIFGGDGDEVAIDTSTTTTTTEPDPCAFVEDLRGPLANHVYLGVDGIGALTAFGDDAETTIQTLTCLLGDPDADSGYVDSFSVFGTCPGSLVRGVRWGPLLTLYGNAMLFDAEPREFYDYRYDAFESPDTLELVFPETGVGLGATIPELEAAYGTDLQVFEDDLTGGAAFVIGEREVAGTTVPLIFGTLTSDQPDATVQFIDVGFPCGE